MLDTETNKGEVHEFDLRSASCSPCTVGLETKKQYKEHYGSCVEAC